MKINVLLWRPLKEVNEEKLTGFFFLFFFYIKPQRTRSTLRPKADLLCETITHLTIMLSIIALPNRSNNIVYMTDLLFTV